MIPGGLWVIEATFDKLPLSRDLTVARGIPGEGGARKHIVISWLRGIISKIASMALGTHHAKFEVSISFCSGCRRGRFENADAYVIFEENF